MAIQKEIWIADIQENLFKDSHFIKSLTDHSAFVNNLTVHVPQAGANPGVQKNRSSFPGTITQRTDTDLTYNMNWYSTDPILLTNIEAYQVNYNKRQSILSQQISVIDEIIGNVTAYAMAPTAAAKIIRTTGALSTGALSSGATGSRSAVTISDIARLKGILDNDNVPMSGRKLLVPSDIYNSQLLAIQDIYQAQSYGSSALPDGVVSRIHGFDIILRPTVASYTTGATVSLKGIDATGTMTGTTVNDNLAIIAYHPAFVSNALGAIDVFYQEGNPAYYGSIFSCMVQHGAAQLRSDGKGIAALVQQ